MSIQAVAWVLEHSPTEGTERLVLLSLANHAAANGADAYPAVATIARETRLSERSVQYALKALLDGGHLRRIGKAPDERIAKNRRPWNYRICGVQTSAPHADQGCKEPPSGVQISASRGADVCTQTVLNQEQTAGALAGAPARLDLDAETRRRGVHHARAARAQLHGGTPRPVVDVEPATGVSS